MKYLLISHNAEEHHDLIQLSGDISLYVVKIHTKLPRHSVKVGRMAEL